MSLDGRDPKQPPDHGKVDDSEQKVDDFGKIEERSHGFTRRVFSRVVALLGIGVLADGISGGKLSGSLLGGHHEEVDLHKASANEAAKLGEVADKVATDLKDQMKGLNDREKALKIVDYLGTAVFAWGIKDLMPDVFKSGHGHIHAAHYGAMLALTGLKAQLSDEEGRRHLKEEWVSTANAFVIISGTIALAEGLKMNLLEAYQAAADKAPSRADKIALMTMLASVLSPTVTTVGSSSIMRDIANKFAEGDQKVIATCVSHTSNLSGYLLFGDPPFIAVCEKYGFAEGIKWQFSTMWPLALYSLFSSTLKLNYFMAQKDGLKGKEAFRVALKNTTTALTRNIPFLAKIVAQSLANVARYFTGMKQDVGGLQMQIGEVLTQKFTNLVRLPFAAEFDTHGHEVHEGVTRDIPEVRVGNDLVATILEKISSTEGKNGDPKDSRSNLRKAIDGGNWDEVERLGAVFQIPNMEIIIATLKDLHDNARIDESTTKPDIPSTLLGYINPARIYDKATDVRRIKTAIGHNLGDVVDVFPFQAGSVPFLLTAFKDSVSAMEAMGLSETEREIITFFMIMIFSMFADNYVACKIGLELYPKKPEIALIAAIQGGSHTAIGNMANIAQFDLNTFSLKDSFKQFGWHLDNIAVGLLWSRALGLVYKTGIITVPEVAKKPEAHASKTEQGQKGLIGMTRRDLFKFGSRNKAT